MATRQVAAAWLLGLAAVLGSGPLWAEGGAELRKVAVLDFAARGVPAEVAANIVDVVTVTLSQAEGYAVISKRDIQETIGFDEQRQLAGCTSSACVGGFGHMLGVDLIVTGAVGLVGDRYVVTVSLIDIQAGRAIGNGQEEAGALGSLPAAARRAVATMLGGKHPIRALSGKGGLFVDTQPTGATVYVDGSPQSGVTPLTVDGLSAGDHQLKVVAGDLTREVPLLVEPDKITKLRLNLAVVRAKFLSVPFDARVFIDGVERGTTPLLVPDVPAERHRVEFVKEGYRTYSEEVLFELTTFRKAGGEAFEVKGELKPKPVVLRVTTQPSGATVLLDSEQKGVTPTEVQAVLPGTHRLAVSKRGYSTQLRDVLVRPGEQPAIDVALPEFRAHRSFEETTWLRRQLTLWGLVGGAVAVVGGGGLALGGFFTQLQAEQRYQTYQTEIDAATLATLRREATDLNGAARLEYALGYTVVGVGAVALLAVLVNIVTMPEEPDYDREQELAPGSVPALPASAPAVTPSAQPTTAPATVEVTP